MMDGIENTRSRARPLAFATLQLLLVAFLDHLTGARLHFFLFYFIPIAYRAWHLGKRAALGMATASAVIWWLIDIVWIPTGDAPAIDAWNTVIRFAAFIVVALSISRTRSEVDRQKKINIELTDALSTIRQLTGILPMCVYCRRIRDEKQQWLPIERYLADHTDAQVSHGMCPQCYRVHHGDPNGT